MIEFVLSKVWLVIGGLALAAVITSAFTTFDNSLIADENAESVESLAEVIEQAASMPSTELFIEGSDVISGQGSIVIRNGLICLEDGGTRKAVSVSVPLLLYEAGGPTDELLLQRGDVLVVRTYRGDSGTVVQLEKVAATAFTASTNLLHSSSVL